MESRHTMTVEKRCAGCMDTGLLKLLAFVLMLTDHLGAAFFPQIQELRVLGRIAFPLYLWCAVVGVCCTRNVWRYALRLFLFALLSQPCYMLGLHHRWYELNVMFTLLCGLMGIIAVREKKAYSHLWGPVLALVLSCAVKMDYGWRGVLLMMLLYAARSSRSAIGAVMTAFCLFWGTSSGTVSDFFGLPLPLSLLNGLPYAADLVKAASRLQFMAILSLPLMLWPRTKRTNLPKALGYAAYPGHLLLLGLIRLALGM